MSAKTDLLASYTADRRERQREATAKAGPALPEHGGPVPTYIEFWRERFGANWVRAARTTANLIASYGTDVVAVTPKQAKTADDEYRRLYGAAHDPVRQAMFLALRRALAHPGAPETLAAVAAAIEAEASGARTMPGCINSRAR